MRKMNARSLKKTIVFLVAIISTNYLFAQSPNKFQLFFEKTYIHTDREYYTAGEDIWMRAYLVNAQTGIRTNTSANLYVELISPTSKVIFRETLHLENGLGNGDFKLPKESVAGKYRLRAYTNWMKNFGSEFLYEKSIEVVGDPSIKSSIPQDAPTVMATAINTATVGTNHLYFFPEGGSMVAGLKCTVAFKAVDPNGKGISIKGKIVAANGDSITAFETSHAGLGNFTFTPKEGNTYTAKGKYYGKELFSEALPTALAKGYTLNIKETNDNNFTATVQVDKATAAILNGQALRIIGRHTGKINLFDSVTIIGQQGTFTIAKNILQDGINAITIYDEKQHPQCERLVYVQSKTPVNIAVTADQPSYSPKQKTNILVYVTDADNQPVHARLSLAATDADLIPANNSNIVSYLLLQSEIHGEIENPLQYFDPANGKRFVQLDLLLQTQGWREFVWRRLVDSGFALKNLPEPGITISGRVERKFGNAGIKDMSVTLFAGNSRGDKIYFTKTDSLGRFFLDGLPLYGWQDVRLTARTSNNKKEGMLMMDTVFGKPLPIKPIVNLVYDTSAQHKNFWQNAMNQNKRMQAQQDRDSHQLQDVTVTGNNKPQVKLQEGGLKYGHADSLFTITLEDNKYETLAYFIEKKYPGAYSDAEHEGFYFYGERNSKIFPHWIVDGREDRSMEASPFGDPETGTIEDRGARVDYNSIPINKVKKVYIQPMIGINGNMTYTVHLSLLPGAFDSEDMSLINTSINGYYEARKYFVPDFKSVNGFTKTDLRSTIFWAPDLQTNADGRANINFTNGDAKTNISVCVEGITDKGVPFVGMVKYGVK